MYTYIRLYDSTRELERFEYTRLTYRYRGLETTTIYEAETFKNELIQLCGIEMYEGCTEYHHKVTLSLLNNIKRLLYKYCKPKGNEYSHSKQWDFRRLLRDCAQVAQFLKEHPNGTVTLIIHE